MNDIKPVRKNLTKILLVNWSKFGAVPIKINGSTLFAGVNGSGKSTILDAMSYVYTGNTQFNKAAQDRDRTVLSYVRGDTKNNGSNRYLRKDGNVISYIALEFFSYTEKRYVTVGVCIESKDMQSHNTFWFAESDTQIDDFNFYNSDKDGKDSGKENLTVTPKNELRVKGKKMKTDDFMNKKNGIAAIHRLLGLRCDDEELKRKLMKMMSFQLENNVDKFIRDNVLAEKEITTVDNLKEQKSKFEEIKEEYSNLLKRQKILDELEDKTVIYEQKQNALDLKRAVKYYQDLSVSRKSLTLSQKRFSDEKDRLERLKQKENELNELYKNADKVKTKAYLDYKSNDLTSGIENLKNDLSNQEKQIRLCNDKIKKIKNIQRSVKSVSDICEFDYDTLKVIDNFDNSAYDSDKKYRIFDSVNSIIKSKTEEFNKKQWKCEDENKNLDESISEISEKIRLLESNIKDFPKEVQEAKNIINKELKARGVNAEVRILAELIEDINMPEWRDAVEVYLRNHKFDLIIDADYVGETMVIFHRYKFRKTRLVMTDKLRDYEADNNSLATVLTVHNKYVRRYINYLLGKIRLCNTLDELHNSPLGGIMTDGTLAKSYTIISMDMSRIEYFIGRDAVELQLETRKEELLSLQEKSMKLKSESEKYRKYAFELKNSDLSNIVLDFEAVNELPDIKKSYEDNIIRLNEMKNNPVLLALSEAFEKAENEFKNIQKDRDRVISEQGACCRQIKAYESDVKINSENAEKCRSVFDGYILMHMELKTKAVSEYERLSESKSDGVVISQSTIDKTESDLKKAIDDMENVQINYNNISERNIEQRGIAYISEFRAERDKIKNVNAEETKNKLEEKQKILEEAFITDFISELSEKVDSIRDELDIINNGLKDLPFGSDIYTFVPKERADKASFFRIKKKIYDSNFGIDLAYAELIMNDIELQQDIEDFMNTILEDSDEREFSDYRYYYSFDMNIKNRTYSNIESDLSAKQGSASNGEKQTPYYIILAASLMNCYPKRSVCARLIFIDEAFSALSQERIEQMVMYFEQNGFQVMYAAPPEKIKSIGTYIDSTVSLVETGRYVNVVEGLIDEFIDE